MSIYSGFSTRRIEQKYNSVLYEVIETLCGELNRLYQITHQGGVIARKLFLKGIRTIRKLDQSKYLLPRFGCAFQSLLASLETQRRESLEQGHVTFGARERRSKSQLSECTERKISVIQSNDQSINFNSARKQDRPAERELPILKEKGQKAGRALRVRRWQGQKREDQVRFVFM